MMIGVKKKNTQQFRRNSSEREGHNINTRYLKGNHDAVFGYTTQGLCEKVYYYYILSSFNLG